MIKYLARGEDPETYYSQSNNVVEAILKKSNVKGWLESCGPTSATMLVDAIGKAVRVLTPGGWSPQPEDALFLWFNDPRNAAEQREILGSWYNAETSFGNEINELYPAAIQHVFGVRCKRVFGALDYADIKAAIDHNVGVMLCLVNPGHFIAVVGYDDSTDSVFYNDPWPGNYWPAALKGQPGHNRRITWKELVGNAKAYKIEIG